MNKHKAEVILEEVTSFLCACGALPAFKETPDEITAAEAKLAKELSELFIGVENRMISELRRRGYIPADAVARRIFVEEFLSFLYGSFTDKLVETALQENKRGRLIAFRDLEENGMNLKYTEFDQWTRDYLRDKSYQFSKSTADRIIGDVADSLAKSYQEGLGIDEAGKELRKVIDGLRDYRLRIIARTEIQSAQNEGIQKTCEEFDVRYKQWLTARDRRVRGNKPKDKANHVMLHGEVVKMNERFSNGLFIPGDRSGPIQEWVACRCRIRPYIPKRGEIILVTPYRPYVKVVS